MLAQGFLIAETEGSEKKNKMNNLDLEILLKSIRKQNYIIRKENKKYENF